MNIIDSEAQQRAVDLQRHCRDCANLFVLSVGEQLFFELKGLSLPKRCPACRRYRRAEREGKEQ